MNLPIDMLSSSIIGYLNIDEALSILPFIANKYERKFITKMQKDYNVIISFMKGVYAKLFRIKCNKELANMLLINRPWFMEILYEMNPSFGFNSSFGFDEYIKEIQEMMVEHFPQYHDFIVGYLDSKLLLKQKANTVKNVNKTKVVIGPRLITFNNQTDNTHPNAPRRIYTPQYIHKIYPVKFVLVIKIKKSNTLRALLY